MIGSARPSSHACDELFGPGRFLEGSRAREWPPELGVVGAHGERHRERAVVADEHRELEMTEIARDRPLPDRHLGARPQSMETREIHDAGLVDLGRRFLDARRHEPAVGTAARAGRVDEEVGLDRRLLGAMSPADARRRAPTTHGRVPSVTSRPATSTPSRKVTPALASTLP